MTLLSSLRFRLRGLLRRGAVERELDDEIHFHIEQETAKYVREGVAPAEAARRARVQFGGVERIKEDTRDARGLVLLQVLMQDLRYAVRGLRSRPGFTAAIVVTLGLGIGANVAMFGVLDRLMFRAPAYLRDPARVHRVYVRYLADGKEVVDHGFSYPQYLQLARQTRSFDVVAPVAYSDLAVGTRDDAREMPVGTVSADFFKLFDGPPALGRYFSSNEDQPPIGTAVAVLGYDFWQGQFGGRNVVGQSIRIGDMVFTIIGVAPRGFAGTSEEAQPVAFIPITTYAASKNANFAENHGWTWLDVLVRRRPGVNNAAADADLSLVYQRNWDSERAADIEQYGKQTNRSLTQPMAATAHARAEAGPLLFSRGPDADQNAHVAIWVMGVALIVLLMACANVTNLLLAHAIRRRREIALRLALGITRRRLLQQLLTESMLLSSLGGFAGLIIAQLGSRTIRSIFLKGEDSGSLLGDGRILVFVMMVTLGVAVLTGLAPALYSLRGDVAEVLKAGSREGSYRRSRVRDGLLLFQSAFSVVLLIGAGLFVRSLSHVRAQRLGYDVEPLVYAEGVSRGVKSTPVERTALLARLLAAAASTPGVQGATLTVSVPFWSNEGRGAPFVPGVDSTRRFGRFALQAGSPSFFTTVGTRIIRGRGFTEDDRATTLPIAVVSESMAAALWPNKDPVGQVMRIGADTNPFITIVGVAENTRVQEISGKPELWYYLPMDQYAARFGNASAQLLIRVRGRAESFTETLRRRLQQEMPGDSYIKTMSLGSLVAPRQKAWESGAKMFLALGGLALALAAIGLYSVVAYMVAQRTHELGIRIALGAGIGDVMRMIVIEGVSFTIAGIAIGSAIAWYAGRWVESLLFAQKANDPVIYASVAGVLLVVAVGATLRPAFRAGRVDPMAALRSD